MKFKKNVIALCAAFAITSTHTLNFFDSVVIALIKEGIYTYEVVREFQENTKDHEFFTRGRFNEAHENTGKVDVDALSKMIAGDLPAEISEIVEFLKSPEKFTRLGAQMPHGVLLVGPPGTGKTSIARAISQTAGAQFIHASGSDFIEMYVGVGPSRVRELFDRARSAIKSGKSKSAIIFIDEIDAIGGRRHAGKNEEYANTLNALLNELDGFEQDESIVVIAATNCADNLDPALLRPGRFDRAVVIDLPDEKSRKEILQLYAKKKKCAKNIDFDTLAQKSKGLSGAELKNVANEAAIHAARDNAKSVQQKHFDQALEKELKKKEKFDYFL